jgi:hypothetical protein
MTNDPIEHAEIEMAGHACDVTAKAVEILRTLDEMRTTGKPVWHWGTGDPFEVLEAARAIRQFPPSSRPLDRPDDVV